jgi:hypothetical protein
MTKVASTGVLNVLIPRDNHISPLFQIMGASCLSQGIQNLSTVEFIETLNIEVISAIVT